MLPRPTSGAQFVLRSDEYVAVVASVGAALGSLTFNGRELVRGSGADEVRESSRGLTLAPWPNRIVDGKYSFGGADYQLPLTEPARSQALHGLLQWAEYSPIEQGDDFVTLQAIVEPQSGYPWRVRVETTYRLSAAGLEQTVTGENLSDSPAPWGTGPHPYLVAGSGCVDDWILDLPAASVITVTPDRLSPVALGDVPAEFDFREPRTIGATSIDHAFTDLIRDGETATVRVTTADGSGVQIFSSCDWVQVYTDDGADKHGVSRAGLAVEPMTCAPDAFNQENYPYDTGLIILAPGASSSASWTIAAIA